jgi:hypothetical protein
MTAHSVVGALSGNRHAHLQLRQRRQNADDVGWRFGKPNLIAQSVIAVYRRVPACVRRHKGNSHAHLGLADRAWRAALTRHTQKRAAAEVTTLHPEREGAATVLHRCCVAPQQFDWFRATPARGTALLWLGERAPRPRHVDAFTQANDRAWNRQTSLSWQDAIRQDSTRTARLRVRRPASPAQKGQGLLPLKGKSR